MTAEWMLRDTFGVQALQDRRQIVPREIERPDGSM